MNRLIAIELIWVGLEVELDMSMFKSAGPIIFILFLSISLSSWGRVNVKDTRVLKMPADTSEPLLSEEAIEKIQPKDVKQGESGQNVLSKMFDNGFSYWWNNSAIKKTSIGQLATQVETKLKTEVDLGSSVNEENEKTQHKVSFKVLAMQALAKLEYTGWLRASLNYDARAAKTEAEILEELSLHQDLVVSQIVTQQESKSQLSLRWNW